MRVNGPSRDAKAKVSYVPLCSHLTFKLRHGLKQIPHLRLPRVQILKDSQSEQNIRLQTKFTRLSCSPRTLGLIKQLRKHS